MVYHDKDQFSGLLKLKFYTHATLRLSLLQTSNNSVAADSNLSSRGLITFINPEALQLRIRKKNMTFIFNTRVTQKAGLRTLYLSL